MQRMWNLKCTIIPVIIGATGIATRSLRKNLEAVPGIHSIDSLQKTAILGKSHIIRKVLQCETWSVSGGDYRWFKRSARKKRPMTRDENNNNNFSVVWKNEYSVITAAMDANISLRHLCQNLNISAASRTSIAQLSLLALVSVPQHDDWWLNDCNLLAFSP